MDDVMATVAKEHSDETGHDVEVFPGRGWGCKVCDPDLFAACEVIGVAFESLGITVKGKYIDRYSYR
jgi:hypothetical protein